MNKNEQNTQLVDTITGEVISEPVYGGTAIDLLKSPTTSFFSSFNPTTRADKIKVYNAINNTDNKLSDYIGKTLDIVDIVAHEVILEDINTKQPTTCARVVLIDKNGKAYSAVSQGVFDSLKRIFAIVDMPPWTEPLKLELRQVTTRKGFKTNVLDIVG